MVSRSGALMHRVPSSERLDDLLLGPGPPHLVLLPTLWDLLFVCTTEPSVQANRWAVKREAATNTS